MRPSKAESQIIGFRAWVDEEADRELGREEGGQALGTGHEIVVEEPRVSVEKWHLIRTGLDHDRMTVSH
jgi:hypothetical protein